MVYGYARVSTLKQASRGNSLEEQKKALKEAGATKIICDKYTGTQTDRPEFNKLLKKLKAGDKLIVTKMDRFARTAPEAGMIVRDLQGKGITMQILNMGIADDSPMGKLMVTILLAFAEFERDMIVERTQLGKELARSRGVRVDGRSKKFGREQLDHAMDLLENYTYSEVVRMTGISKSTLIREVKRRREKDILQTDDNVKIIIR